MRKIFILIAAMIMCNAYGETVNWIVDDALIDQTSCTSGDNITKPTEPTKTGYQFVGWKRDAAKEAVITKLASLVDTNGSSYTPTSNKGASEWTVTWSDGTVVSGTSFCSSASGMTCYSTTGVSCTTSIGKPSVGGGVYCWCKVTGVKINGTTTSMPLLWVHGRGYANNSLCANDCGFDCSANYISRYSVFRRAVFGLQ